MLAVENKRLYASPEAELLIVVPNGQILFDSPGGYIPPISGGDEDDF